MLTISERTQHQNELIRRMIESYVVNLHVAAPGIVESFDSSKGTATVQIAIREQVNLAGDLSWETIPILVDVPVVILRAGGFAVTFPVKKGDEGWLFFCDSQIDHFWESGKVSNQSDIRHHDLSDAFFLPSSISQPNVVSSYSSSNFQVRNETGDILFEMSSSGITIKAKSIVLANGGNPIARVGDQITGTTSDGATVTGYIVAGSSNVTSS